MKKRILSFLMAFCMVAVLLPTAALADDTLMPAGVVFQQLKQSPFTFAGGSGTREDPYLVSTPDQLNAIRQGLDKHYKLTNDIDLSGWGNWLPIGGEVLNRYGEATRFTGSFDGAGHVIFGMTITGTDTDFQPAGQRQGHGPHFFGLFAYVQGSETNIKPGDACEDTTLGGVFNLGVINYTINITVGDTTINAYSGAVGAIAGIAENARIVGCWSAAGTAQMNKGNLGGIVGRAKNSAIRECWNNSALTCMDVGGIAGGASDVWISHCFNTGTLKGSSRASGIASGWVSSGGNRIMYCYNAGVLSGGTVIGIGDVEFLDNIYNAGSLSGESISPIAIDARLGISHNGERYLKDENWTDSPTLKRKVLVVLREDELTAAVAVKGGVGGFEDVQPADYFADAVIWAVGRKITTGTSNTTFSPRNTCSKAEAITFIYRTELEPSYWGFSSEERVAFQVVNPDWYDSFYYHSAQWAFDEGMITTSTRFADPCTRADFVTYLWKAAGSPKTQTTSQFTDVPASAAYAQAVAWAVKNGVTTGTSATTFSPNDTCTRAQIVTFLYRAYRNA